jgi:hypothetical protein
MKYKVIAYGLVDGKRTPLESMTYERTAPLSRQQMVDKLPSVPLLTEPQETTHFLVKDGDNYFLNQ